MTLRSVDELFSVLRDERGGDVVTALAHALQCAWLLRQARPDDVALQIAGLVHDVASSLDPPLRGDHAAEGARLVSPLLGARVAELVGAHVIAKRYLVAVDPSYRDRLSANSRAALARQGDALSEPELAAFSSSALLDDCVALRRADDAAKDPERDVPGLDFWRPLVDSVAR